MRILAVAGRLNNHKIKKLISAVTLLPVFKDRMLAPEAKGNERKLVKDDRTLVKLSGM